MPTIPPGREPFFDVHNRQSTWYLSWAQCPICQQLTVLISGWWRQRAMLPNLIHRIEWKLFSTSSTGSFECPPWLGAAELLLFIIHFNNRINWIETIVQSDSRSADFLAYQFLERAEEDPSQILPPETIILGPTSHELVDGSWASSGKPRNWSLFIF